MERITNKKIKTITTLFILLIFCATIAASFFLGYIYKEKVGDINNIELPTTTDSALLYHYNGLFLESNQQYVDEIINNPIDKYFYNELNKSSAVMQEIEVLGNWIKKYDTIYDYSTRYLTEIIEKNYSDYSDIQSLINSFDAYCKEISNYTDLSSDFVFQFEDCTLGHGTNSIYDSALTELNIKRIHTLKIIECIYDINGDFDWNQFMQ